MRKPHLAVLLLATALLWACLPPLRTLGPSPSAPTEFVDEAKGIPVPPDRDLLQIAQRLRTGGAPVPRLLNAAPPDYPLGHQETFWITDLQALRHFTVTATLRYVTPHAYMYLQDGQNVSLEALQRSAQGFEERILPTVTKYYGANWRPGVDNDPRLSIVNARIPAAAGFFSAADQYPTVVNPFSNQRKAVYMSLDAVRPGSPAYESVLAHEFQHALYWDSNPSSEAWINEGAAELAAELVTGRPSGYIPSFLNQPDTQLNAWPEDPGASAANYGAALLFLRYLAQCYGGYEALKDIMAAPGRGPQAITNYLAAKGHKADFDAVFKDWVIANYLSQPGQGRCGYRQEQRAAKSEPVKALGEMQGTVHQYAADYLELGFDSGDILVEFQGQPQVPLLPAQAHSGRAQWWANRGDSIASTLTRGFDLGALAKATLRFWAWYDIEKNWDYAYVEVSSDGGRTWAVQPGTHTSTENPLGNSFGPGYTGTSGGGKESVWVEETVDLTPFAGKKVLVRFEYITDEEVNKVGLALDDISIPELGFADDAEGDGGWEARGFFRTSNPLRQHFVLQVIKMGDQTTVEDVPVDQAGRARLELRGFGQGLQKAVLVVAARTPVTTEVAPYRVVVERVGR